MADKDRFNIDADKSDFIRSINKNNSFLEFDNQKDLFIYAAVLGNEYSSEINGKKEALFLDKDLNSQDVALIYSLAYPELDSIEDISDKEKIYSIVENMADAGFSFIKQRIEEESFGNVGFKLLEQIDDKYQKLEQNGGLKL